MEGKVNNNNVRCDRRYAFFAGSAFHTFRYAVGAAYMADKLLHAFKLTTKVIRRTAVIIMFLIKFQ